MILTGTSRDLPLNFRPRDEGNLERLYEYLDEPENKLYMVQGIVASGIAPVVQPPKEVPQLSNVSTKQEALVSFFTNDRGADRFRTKLVKELKYKESMLTVSSIPVKDVMDLIKDIDACFGSDFGIGVRAEVYYVRHDIAVIGDVLFSDYMLKN